MTEGEREANVDSDPGDDRAPLLSFPPKNGSTSGSTRNAINIINAEGDTEGASGSRFKT